MFGSKKIKEPRVVPKHIGIIMDGNGRWAQERGMIRTMGHKHAVSTLKDLCVHMADRGIKYVSLYDFSTENPYEGKFNIRFVRTIKLNPNI